MRLALWGSWCAWQTQLTQPCHAASIASWDDGTAGVQVRSVGAHDVAPVLAGVDGLGAQLLLDAQQLVVLGQPLRPGAGAVGLRSSTN